MELSRRITRSQWKVIWRQERVIRRENNKVVQDCLAWGIGYAEITADFPYVRRIDPRDIYIGGDDGKV